MIATSRFGVALAISCLAAASPWAAAQTGSAQTGIAATPGNVAARPGAVAGTTPAVVGTAPATAGTLPGTVSGGYQTAAPVTVAPAVIGIGNGIATRAVIVDGTSADEAHVAEPDRVGTPAR